MSRGPVLQFGGEAPALRQAIWRGLRGRCPRCGEGRLFGRFLKVRPECDGCGLEFHHHRADDFPPYIVMFAVGHLLGYGVYISETRFDAVPMWFHLATWPTLAIVLSLALIQPVKGAVVGLQYALGMHGFERAAGGRRPGALEGDGERVPGREADAIRVGRRPRAALAEPDP